MLPPSAFKDIHFTVDAALFRELGERLVGQPEMALAELVKNSYDADAKVCSILGGETVVSLPPPNPYDRQPDRQRRSTVNEIDRPLGGGSSGDLQFSVDAQILLQLGEQLVARQSIALSELVKNGYDADATTVTILLDNVRDRSGGEIIVQDDGHGMSLSDVEAHWMRIATPNKADRGRSRRFGRPLAGAKGVGRFAARKLGGHLRLLSVAEGAGGPWQSTADFDWERSFRPGTDITRVHVPYAHRRTDSSIGTVLQIGRTQEPWSVDDVREVREDLATLVNPFRYSENTEAAEGRRPFEVSLAFPEKEGFDVTVEAPEFPELGGSLVDLVLGGAYGSVAGHVVDGKAHYRVLIRETGEDLPFEYDGDPEEGPPYPRIQDATFLIYFFPKGAALYEDVDLGYRQIQTFLRAQSGVRVYLDGFRVFSYGGTSDDWLKLTDASARRSAGPFDFTTVPGGQEALRTDRPALLIPRPNQLFGTVELARDRQPDIVVSADRERLDDNAAFDELVQFVRQGVTYLTVQYARVTAARRRARKDERAGNASSAQIQAAQERVAALSDLIVKASEALPSPEAALADQLREDVVALQETLSAARIAVDRREDDYITERSMLRVLASAGTVVGVVNHQLHTLVAQTQSVDGRLAQLASETDPSPEDIQATSDAVGTWRRNVERQLDLLGLLLSREARERRRRLALRPVVEAVVDAFQPYAQDFRIGVEVDVPSSLRTPPLFEAELSAVLANALSNAFKAVLRREDRRVKIEAVQTAARDALTLRLLDTGVGVSTEDRERVFEPFYTSSVSDPVLGVGTGLGLTVLRDITAFYGGGVAFVDAPPPWRTSLEITLPYP